MSIETIYIDVTVVFDSKYFNFNESEKIGIDFALRWHDLQRDFPFVEKKNYDLLQ